MRKNTGGYGGQGIGVPIPPCQQKKLKGIPGGVYSNTMKLNNNLYFCYSCRYYVNHNGWQCHPNNRKRKQIPNVSQEEEYTIAGASMKAQHKTLPDGSGDRKGWILAQQPRKENWVMDQNDTWKQQQQQQ